VVSSCAQVETTSAKHTICMIPPMSSWEDHEEMIDDQYLMESIEEDQKLAEGDADDDSEDRADEE